MNFKDWLENNCADEGLLQDWYQSSVDESNPVWTDEHISELTNDFYVIPKDNVSKFAKVNYPRLKSRACNESCKFVY